jgi:hypothetical protein
VFAKGTQKEDQQNRSQAHKAWLFAGLIKAGVRYQVLGVRTDFELYFLSRHRAKAEIAYPSRDSTSAVTMKVWVWRRR